MKKQILFILAALLLSWSAGAQMVLEFNTNLSDGKTIMLPLYGTVNATVNWGDANSNTYTTAGTQEHTYAAEGTYTVSITGSLTQFGNEWDETLIMDKLVKVTGFGDIGLTSLNGAFFRAANLEVLPSALPSTVHNLSYMLCGASKFNGNIGSWNVSSVTNMDNMLYEAKAFNQDISSWNVSEVTNMRAMFYEAKAFNQNIGSWTVSKVTDMGYMFNGAAAFDQNIGNWDVSKVTDMEKMFSDTYVFNQDIGKWDVSSVTTMQNMFASAYIFNQDISTWDVSKVTYMGGMFQYAHEFNRNISTWDVSKVTDMGWMFYRAYKFNQNIGAWNVSMVTGMREMFHFANTFNQDISTWDVSSVTNMMLMFDGITLSTTNYNKLLIGWAAQTVKNNVWFHGGYSKYSAGDAAAARAVLTETYAWQITDGGEVNTLAVSTIAPTGITSTSATSGGNITNDGGSAVTARGVVWGTTANPTIESNAGITADGTGMGTFAGNITGLTELTTYYVRAYATNTKGTEYGESMEFTTINATFTVTFTVTNNAVPLAGATITFNGVDYTTNTNGKVVVPDVISDTYNYTVTKAGYVDATGQIVVAGADVEETITLNPSYSVTLTIVDGEGVPVDAVFVIFDGVKYTINTGGIATITDVANGTYNYTVTKEGYINATGQIVVAGADVEETITLNLVTYVVTFTVLRGNGTPIQDATFTFNGTEYLTNTNGKVTFTSIINGTYDYTVTLTGFVIVSGQVVVAGADVEETITLKPAYSVTLTIVDGEGAPVDAVNVTFDGVEYGINTGGIATIIDVTDGTYDYTVTKEGYIDATGQIVVSGADVEETITLNLVTYNVTFTVLRGNGTPIQNATLTFDGVEYLTHTNGKVSITNVLNGTYNYTVNMEDYDVATGNIVVDRADVEKTITLGLLINNDITITVVNSNITPIEGATVTFNGIEYTSGSNGIVTIIDVADGTYDYTVTKVGYVDATGQIVVAGSDVEKRIILVPLSYNVTLTIVDAEAAPIEGATVTFDGVEYTTGSDGIATITDVADGTYDYTVRKENYVEVTGQIVVAGADVEETIIVLPVGIGSDLKSNLQIYPNPFNNEITITNAERVNCVTITNIVGQQVMTITLTGSTQIINVSELHSGVYFVAFEGINGERIVRKMIKK